jgi:hypothetical protein
MQFEPMFAHNQQIDLIAKKRTQLGAQNNIDGGCAMSSL